MHFEFLFAIPRSCAVKRYFLPRNDFEIVEEYHMKLAQEGIFLERDFVFDEGRSVNKSVTLT
jgi:hypothetical protein